MIAEKDIEVKQLVCNSLIELLQELDKAKLEKWRVRYEDAPYISGYRCICTLERDVKILPPIVNKGQSTIKGAK